MSLVDVLTVVVLAFIGVRIASGTRAALVGQGRARVLAIVRGLRPRHFLLAIPVLAVVLAAVVALLQVPGLDFGWWTAIGGIGNPVTGATENTSGTVLEWLVPLVFLVLLIPALALFAEAEERIFRLGSERRSTLGRVGKGIQFGLAHATIGIPIGAALGLSVGGWYFTWCYLRVYRRTGSPQLAMLESTRAHVGYNATVIVIVVTAILLAPT